MPNYDFECKNCNEEYDALAPYDETGKYPNVECPHCGSKKKTKLISCCSFNFANPEGTDRWNNSQTGHDYRYKFKQPQVRKEREMAEAMSHMGNPYVDNTGNDLDLGEGIHDPETRKGLG